VPDTNPNVGESGEKAIVSMEYDLRWELPVFKRRLAVADAAVAAILRQASPMLFVGLLERVEANKRQQQLVVCLVDLALEDVLRVQIHATLYTHSGQHFHYLRQREYVIVVVCLSVCLLATLHKKLPNRFA